MIPLALDLSLTATGWAAPGASGVLSPPSGVVRGLERLIWIRDRVLGLVNDHGADVAVLEGYSFGQARGTSQRHSAGELGGIVRVALFEAGIPVVEVAPASLKKYATGKGNAPKEAVLAAAIRRLGFEGHDHNESDALWLLHMALDHFEAPGCVDVPKVHREALTAVQWPHVTAGIET